VEDRGHASCVDATVRISKGEVHGARQVVVRRTADSLVLERDRFEVDLDTVVHVRLW
jgi:hypothetical protein